MAEAKATCVEHHTAFIYERGGARRIDELTSLSQVVWSRVRDNTSEGMIRLEGESCSENASIINQARTHRHELVLFRGRERVWEGPIHRIASHSTYAEIHAKDVSTYLNYQPLTQRYSNATEGGVEHVDTVTGRIEKIIQYELANGRTMQVSKNPQNDAEVPGLIDEGWTIVDAGDHWLVTLKAFEALDPPINVLPFLDVRHFPNEAETAMVTEAYETTVGAHLQSLARQNGIDFTVLGRKLLIWDVSRHLGVLGTMTANDFESDVIVTEYGADHTQAAYSVGQNGMYGQALQLRNLDFYGPWTTMYTIYHEEGNEAPSQPELDSQASRNLSGRSPAPIEVRVPDGSSILLNPDIQLNSLVPGVQVPLRATLNYRPLAQQQKIDIVKVIETAEGEKIQVTLTPATRADSDAPEEE
jgi:hypothetical protein